MEDKKEFRTMIKLIATKPCVVCGASISRWQTNTPSGDSSWGNVRYCSKCRTVVARKSIEEAVVRSSAKLASTKKLAERICRICGKRYFSRTGKKTCAKCS